MKGSRLESQCKFLDPEHKRGVGSALTGGRIRTTKGNHCTKAGRINGASPRHDQHNLWWKMWCSASISPVNLRKGEGKGQNKARLGTMEQEGTGLEYRKSFHQCTSIV